MDTGIFELFYATNATGGQEFTYTTATLMFESSAPAQTSTSNTNMNVSAPGSLPLIALGILAIDSCCYRRSAVS